MRPTDADLLLPLERSSPSPGAEAGVRYDAFATRSGAVHLVPRRPGLRGAATRLAATLRWRRSPGDSITVVGPQPATPAVVQMARPGAIVQRVTFESDPRRRAAFIVARRSEPAVIVKVTRSPSEAMRSEIDQTALARIASTDVAARTPRPLGFGEIGGAGWSVESLASGVPMSRAPGRWHRRHAMAVLEAIAVWLGDVGAATAHERRRPLSGVHPMRGVALERLAPLLDAVADVPAVTVHGDLASGANILVRRRAFAIIDWETAVDDGLPLTDLLPTLALGIARLRASSGASDQAAYVIKLCRGETTQSPWLFEAVDAQLTRLGVPAVRVGELAALAWGYQASMRARHDELVIASGRTPVPWTSPAELLLDAWLEDDELGLDWHAFTRSRKALGG